MTYFSFIKYTLLPSLLLVIGGSLYAQEVSDKELPTRKVDRKVKEDTRKNQPGKHAIAYIYVKDGEKLLYGNRCAIEETHQMGFEYVLEDKRYQDFGTKWRRFGNNLKIKTKLVFTKGPWWKATLNKRLKQCAQSTGDFTG
ncbi:hypothetical protein N6H18_04850 [Reichenbachiella agarivorans]|uniref:Uncharacterized protein n=1 Tax=Reichenbachiella agarivorans TaxID=2979464 RepID=A0ABY6CRY5_9BACT|nr:hypothetical protein [Reichenbachiella agarivorans]UXP33277.1 hypothetical protein N6H18_04850 [Reichenbachiella agarivorans]